MGVVFAARHAVIERPLAIKVLKREVMRDPATIQAASSRRPRRRRGSAIRTSSTSPTSARRPTA